MRNSGPVDGASSISLNQAKEVMAAYYAMIELIDDNVGRMIQALEESGQRENTLVIFTSDHGELLGDHQLVGKGCRFYECLVRVPLICSWPGRVQEGRVCDALVELMDIAPTLLELAEVPAPDRMQGRSLWPLLTGQTQTHRAYVRSEYYRALNPDAPGREHLQVHLRHDDPRPALQTSLLPRPHPRRTVRSWRKTQASSTTAGTTQPTQTCASRC